MCDNDKSNHATLKNRQPQSYSETETHINISLLPSKSTVALLHEDGPPQMQRMTIWTTLQDQSDENRTHHNQKQVIHDSQPNICGGLSQKQGKERQQKAVK